ncbi:MAG TPA: transporter substrate-binding domain-containing protein [Alphaproteobacteria bacterium]|jgi:ABC-type amino acid transport substrate-binding protein|nr:transporter substrate-binding domain-containing protein [Alphaproteobacteria bacterium]MCB9984237.1 transporter substrate-binding domain-containing protein [Micavibrio sp.]HRK97081.1 transporter substrate-binding domain-containing protein [Alphaproteobacteria bacterium]
MRYFIFTLLFIFTALPAFSAEGAKESAYDRVIRTGVLRCGYILLPPETIKDMNTGKLSGIAFDLTEEVAKRLGVKVNWIEEVNFSTMTEGLNSNRYDAVCFSLYRYSLGAKFADFSVPLFYSKTGIYVREDDHRFDKDFSLINSEDITIATVDGEMSHFIAQDDFPNAKTLSMPQSTDLSQMMVSVETKKADVTFLNGIVAKGYMDANLGKIRDISGDAPLRVYSHGLMFAKGQYDLVKTIDLILSEMHDHGAIDKILDRYDPSGTTYFRTYKSYKVQK